MIKANGQSYQTIADAARMFGVAAKTVQEWIRKGIISKPPEVEYGAGMIQTFPPEYMDKARKELAQYRKNKGQNNN